MRKTILELSAYGAAAVVALGIDLSLLALLVSGMGWHYLAAASLSFVTGGVVLYLLSVRFVFRFRRIGNPMLELSYFIGLGIIGLLINALIMLVAIEIGHLHYLLAKAGSATCTFGANFFLRRHLLFSSRAQHG